MSYSSIAAESSLLLWVLSTGVIVMAALVSLGWLRQAQLTPRLRDNGLAVLIAATSLGTGICGAIVLGLSAEVLSFSIGYRLRDVPLLWLGTVAACFVALALLGRSRRWFAVLAGGALLGATVVVAQLGWVNAIGLRPGVVWRSGFIVAAAVLTVVAMTAGLWLALAGDRRRGSQQHLLGRLGSVLLVGLSVVGSQEILLSGSNLLAQVASVYRRDVPASLLCLVLGVLAPLAYVPMIFDLRMRRRQQRRDRRHEARSRHSVDPLVPDPVASAAAPTDAAPAAAAAAAPVAGDAARTAAVR